MKMLKKTTYVMLLAFITILAGCSSDDDSGNDPQDPGSDQGITEPFGLGEIYQKDLDLPTHLNQSPDEKAMELVSDYAEVISFQDDSDIAEVPAGAEMSHEPVNVGTGKSTDRQGYDYTVYTFTAGGVTTIYQFSVQNGQEVFELFQSYEEGGLGLTKLYEIRQSMDGTSGTASFYIFGAAVTWTWQINADGSVFITYGVGGSTLVYEAQLNPDGSGYLKVYLTDSLQTEYHWSADGSGTWTDNTTGESGSWN